jgi:hypothetical protein
MQLSYGNPAQAAPFEITHVLSKSFRRSALLGGILGKPPDGVVE